MHFDYIRFMFPDYDRKNRKGGIRMDRQLQRVLRKFQVGEKTGHEVYMRLSRNMKLSEESRNALKDIAGIEKVHGATMDRYLGIAEPDRFKVWLLCFVSRVLGITFTLKQMETIQDRVIPKHLKEEAKKEVPEFSWIFPEEEETERSLLNMLDERKLLYVSSMVLGLNDALVELSGALAGFTFAMRDSRLIALAGIITGISASLSMAASEYLSTSADVKSGKNPLRAAIYTGIAYVVTVSLMVMPYLLLPAEQYLLALVLMLVLVVSIIVLFTYYISVAKDIDFRRHLRQMLVVSLSVATASFFIGILVKNALKIDL